MNSTMKVTQYYSGGIHSTSLRNQVYIKTHINSPFSAREYVNFNELYTSHDHLYQGVLSHDPLCRCYKNILMEVLAVFDHMVCMDYKILKV